MSRRWPSDGELNEYLRRQKPKEEGRGKNRNHRGWMHKLCVYIPLENGSSCWSPDTNRQNSMGNRPDMVVLVKTAKKAVVIEQLEQLEMITDKEMSEDWEIQRAKKRARKMWKVKTTVVTLVLGTLRAVTPNWKNGSSDSRNKNWDLYPEKHRKKLRNCAGLC